MFDWINDLKEGDKVCYDSGMLGRGLSVTTVERVTKTQVILSGNSGRYRKSDGYLVGRDRWSTIKIREPNKDNLMRARRCRLEEKISNISRMDRKKIQNLKADEISEIEAAIATIKRLLEGK